MLFNNAFLPAIMFLDTNIFLSFCVQVIHIFSRVDHKLELGMQLDCLIKLNLEFSSAVSLCLGRFVALEKGIDKEVGE